MRFVRFPGGAVGEIPDPPEPRPSKIRFSEHPDDCPDCGHDRVLHARDEGGCANLDCDCPETFVDSVLPAPLPEEPQQNFAEEMRASSWRQWVDAHPAEEPPELKEALSALLDAKGWLLESTGYTEDHKEFCRKRFRTARAAVVALFVSLQAKAEGR